MKYEGIYHNHTPVWLFCPLEKSREATCTHSYLPALPPVAPATTKELGNSL
ncbi:hypothetical protein ACLB1E_03100 [Escherichia coli]